MAFLLAIVFAFATNGTQESDNALVTGYIYSNNNCVALSSHDCTVQGNDLCTIDFKQVYKTKSGTNCSIPLMRW